MKAFCTLALPVLALGSLIASAAESPRLAIAPAEPSAALAKKFSPSASTSTAPATAAVPASRPSVLQGTWRGIWKPIRGRPAQIVVRLLKAEDGALRGEIENPVAGKMWQAKAAISPGNHFTLNLGDSAGTGNIVPGGVWEADVDSGSGTMTASWKRDGHNYALTLHRTGEPSGMESARATSGAPAAPPPRPLYQLEDILNAINLYLVDRFDSARLFTVVEDTEVKHALAASGDQGKEMYNLKNPATKARFQKAGIQYLLVTTVEDFTDQTIDVAQGTVQTQKREINGNDRLRINREQQLQWNRGRMDLQDNYNRERFFNGSSSAMQTQRDAQKHKQQHVRLAVRYRLHNAVTGELLQRGDRTFATNRTYAVLAQGDNALSSADLFDVAAKSIAEWAAVLAGERVFPIKVLEKNGSEITINRGLEAGLKVGHLYNVYTKGKEIKEPSTGEILGYDEVTVGRVAISELHQKFSKARVLEDKAIEPGGELRRFQPR